MNTSEAIGNVASALMKVMQNTDYVQKKGKNTHFNYSYVTEADLIEKIRPELIKAGLIIIPNVRETSVVNNLTTIIFDYTIVHVETGEFVTSSVVGHGSDNQDKGAYKAATGAMKYLLSKLSLIATGDDPEKDSDDDKKASKPNAAKKPADEKKEEKRGELKTSSDPSNVKRFKYSSAPIILIRKQASKDGINKELFDYICAQVGITTWANGIIEAQVIALRAGMNKEMEDDFYSKLKLDEDQRAGK